MLLNYGITGDRRKEFADAVGEILNEKVSLDVPSNYYVMGKKIL